MKLDHPISGNSRAIMLLLVGALSTVPYADAQIRSQSPASLIRRLINGSDPGVASLPGTFTCGTLSADAKEKRALASSLANWGPAAVAEIEGAINGMEQSPGGSEVNWNAPWLLYAYAKVRGRAAFPRLRRLSLDRRFEALEPAVCASLALSLGLTSYITSSVVPTDIICRATNPRDALDRFILAWIRNDLQLFESSLTRHSRDAMNIILAGRSWSTMRSELWYAKPGVPLAIGYKFDITDPLSEPSETLSSTAGTDLNDLPDEIEIETTFNNWRGTGCGNRNIKFRRSDFSEPYLIDNSDLKEVLQSLSFCAANGQ